MASLRQNRQKPRRLNHLRRIPRLDQTIHRRSPILRRLILRSGRRLILIIQHQRSRSSSKTRHPSISLQIHILRPKSRLSSQKNLLLAFIKIRRQQGQTLRRNLNPPRPNITSQIRQIRTRLCHQKCLQV